VKGFALAMAARHVPWWFTDERQAGARRRSAAWNGGTRAFAVLGAYALVGGLSAAVAAVLGHNPVVCDGWLGARGAAGLLLSLGLGVCLGAITIAATRAIVRRAQWARALHAALRPAVYGAGDAMLLALALASAAGEELLFRGLLVPTVGVLASSLVFGVLHQIRGRGRWGWMAWATLMGLLFAVVFTATGSLAGPLVAHAAINHANLRFLRDNDPDPPPRFLGGLLRR
jgi:membrane protease YdiL (CAAX protease family)